MDKNQQIEKELSNYVQQRSFKEALHIPLHAAIELTPLAQGEYNRNYTFFHPVTKEKLLFRINTGSQMHLEHQIEYEYHALELLSESHRTPKPIYVDGSKTQIAYGVMVMEFLEGRGLRYETDMELAAQILADIHSVPVTEEDGLICPKDSLSAILEECEEMVKTYYDSPLADKDVKQQIERMLKKGWQKQKRAQIQSDYRCMVNTELNSGNFLINGEGQPNYLIDWEKPLYGEVAQDLGHFLAPTTTFWKTDTILTHDQVVAFVKTYIKNVAGRFSTKGVEQSVDVFISITCLRGITWCAMAWVEYQQPDRILRNEATFKKIEAYLKKEFLDDIEKEYLDF